MSYPVLFRHSATAFNTQGLGTLSDAIECTVTEELNGTYELSMKYPITGIHYGEIQQRRIIVYKPPYDQRQAMRIYHISEPIDGVVTINARHITYDLSGYPVEPYTAATLEEALSGLVDNCKISCPFTFTTSTQSYRKFTVSEPASIRSLFGGKEGSFIDVYRREWKFDNFTCDFVTRRGADRGVTIRYGKNLLRLDKSEESTDYSHIWAFYRGTDKNEDEVLVMGSLLFLQSRTPQRVYLLDASEHFEGTPTRSELNDYATSYASDNDITELSTTYTIDWVQLNDLQERVELGDTVTVVFNNVTYSARVVKATWDVLKERYTSIDVGKPKVTMYNSVRKIAKTQATNVLNNARDSFADLAYNAQQNANDFTVQMIDSNIMGNLIQNGVEPTTTALPNIQGDTTHGMQIGSYTVYFDYGSRNGSRSNIVFQEETNGYRVVVEDDAEFGLASWKEGPCLFTYSWGSTDIRQLMYGEYTFSVNIESDYFKNYTVRSGVDPDNVVLRLEPCFYAWFRKNQNTTKYYKKFGEAISWSYDERSTAKSARINITFNFDEDDNSEYSTATENWDEVTTPVVTVEIALGVTVYISKTGSVTDVTKTGQDDSYVKVTEMQLEQGTVMTDWRPAQSDNYVSIPNDKIDALFV